MNLTHVEPPQLGPGRRQDTTPQTLEHRVHRAFQEAGYLKDAWNDLALRTGDVLCSFDWCEVWWRYFGRGRRLEIHTLHDAERLVAVLPLFRETIHPGGIRLRTVRTLGCDYTISVVGLAIEPEHAESFIQMVLERLSRDEQWDIVQIGALRSYNQVADVLAKAAADSEYVQAVISGRCDNWCTLFPLPETYEAFLAALPGKTRTEINRRERQFREKHRVEVEVVSRPQQVQAILDILIDLHQKRWTGKGQPGQFEMPDIGRFHHELAQRLAPTGQLMLLVLRADDQIVSITYGYHFAERTHALFGSHSYDQQWQRYGIGRIMYMQLVRHAIERGSRVIEDGRGIFEHKLSLGGQMEGERSLAFVRAGRGPRLRFWAGLRAAYVVHVLYSRVWIDMIAPRIGVHPKGRHWHLRNLMLAQLYRRVRFPLLGRARLLEARCLTPKPSGGEGK